MAEDTTYVGLDTHLRKILVSMLPPGAEAVEWQVPNEPASVRRMFRKLAGHRPIRICYEAGPLRNVLTRQLDAADLPCSGDAIQVDKGIQASATAFSSKHMSGGCTYAVCAP